MFRAFKTIGPILLLIAATACGGSGSNKSEQPSSPAAAPDARKVDTATAANVTGRVVFEGTPPPNVPLKMGSDPFCAGAHKETVTAPTYVVDNGGLENVFVYVKDGLGNKYIFDTPTERVHLDQKGCEYQPHVVGVRVGQPLEITSSDNTTHNVHAIPETNREFNYGYPVAGMKQTVTFTAPEVLIPFKCDVHSWMNAYIGVVNHPYFAITATGGKFELRSLPPGTYTIEAVHEKLGRQSQSVTLGEKDSKEITFTFKAGGSASD